MRGIRVAIPGDARSIKHWTGSRYDWGVYDEGYDFIDPAGTRGYTVIPNWGRDGWDLGDWPYVMYFINPITNTVMEYVEGDLTFWQYATRAQALERIDQLFLAWSEPVKERLEKLDRMPTTTREVPDEYRGPFSWARLEREKEEGTK